MRKSFSEIYADLQRDDLEATKAFKKAFKVGEQVLFQKGNMRSPMWATIDYVHYCFELIIVSPISGKKRRISYSDLCDVSKNGSEK